MVLVIALNVMILAPIMAVGGVIMAVREDVELSALLIVIIPLLGLFIGLMLSRALPLFRVMQVKVDRINQVIRRDAVRDTGSSGRLSGPSTRNAALTTPPRPDPDGAAGQPPVRADDPDGHGHLQPVERGDPVVSGRSRSSSGSMQIGSLMALPSSTSCPGSCSP